MTTPVLAASRDPLAANPTVAWLVPWNGHYQIRILEPSSARMVQGDLRLSKTDLGGISRNLLARWQEEIGRDNGDFALQRSLQQSQDDFDSQLVEFASAGNSALRKILDGFDGEQDMRSYVASLFAKLLKREISLAVTCDVSPPLPWRMLYADPDAFDREITTEESPASINPWGFFGLAGIIGEFPGTSPRQAAAGNTVSIGVHESFRANPGGVQDVQAIFPGNNGLKVLDAKNKKELRVVSP